MELNDSSGDLESGVEDGDESGETCVEGAGDVALAKRILTGISLACTGIRRLWETACRRERVSKQQQAQILRIRPNGNTVPQFGAHHVQKRVL